VHEVPKTFIRNVRGEGKTGTLEWVGTVERKVDEVLRSLVCDKRGKGITASVQTLNILSQAF